MRDNEFSFHRYFLAVHSCESNEYILLIEPTEEVWLAPLVLEQDTSDVVQGDSVLVQHSQKSGPLPGHDKCRVPRICGIVWNFGSRYDLFDH